MLTFTEPNGSSRFPSAVLCFDHGADVLDRRVEAARDLTVRSFQLTRTRSLSVEFGGKPRAVHAESVNLVGELRPGLVGLQPPLHGGIKRIQRLRQALGRGIDRGIDRGLIAHCSAFAPMGDKPARPNRSKNCALASN